MFLQKNTSKLLGQSFKFIWTILPAFNEVFV